MAVVDRVVQKRLANQCDSYYKEKHALALKPLLDSMIADRKQRSFNAKEHNKSLVSLFLQINRAWVYLKDHLDPDGRYAALREEVFISKEIASGEVLLSFEKKRRLTVDALQGISGDTTYTTTAPAPIQSVVTETPEHLWREPLMEYLDNGEVGTEFHVTGILISEESLDYVIAQVGMMAGMVSAIVLSREEIHLNRIG